jgi:hypothetical protein
MAGSAHRTYAILRTGVRENRTKTSYDGITPARSFNENVVAADVPASSAWGRCCKVAGTIVATRDQASNRYQCSHMGYSLDLPVPGVAALLSHDQATELTPAAADEAALTVLL